MVTIHFDITIGYSSCCLIVPLWETVESRVARNTEIMMVNVSKTPVSFAGGNLLNETTKKTLQEVIAAPHLAILSNFQDVILSLACDR